MPSKATILRLSAVLLLSGCKHGPREHDTAAHLMVTSPLRKDAEITREYVGQIRAVEHIELRAQERGYLTGIFVDEGQLIQEGQKMFQIMPMLYQAELQQARSEADFARIEYQNTKSLSDRNVVSANELALAAAKMKKAQATRELAQVRLNLTEIKAPFRGIMGRFQVRLGSLLDEGDLLTTLSDNDTMWVYFNVSEPEYLNYKLHTADDELVPVKLRMANGQIFDQPGKVETIEADFNNETGNIAFRATFANPHGVLRHGETGKILMTSQLKNALIIPQKAVFDVLDKHYVYVVDAKGIARSREVTVAHELPYVYAIASGLSERDKILIDGIRKVRDGTRVIAKYQPANVVMANLELPVH